MKPAILILLIIAGCFGCKNSNVYSRGETPDWYDEPSVQCTYSESEECVA